MGVYSLRRRERGRRREVGRIKQYRKQEELKREENRVKLQEENTDHLSFEER